MSASLVQTNRVALQLGVRGSVPVDQSKEANEFRGAVPRQALADPFAIQ